MNAIKYLCPKCGNGLHCQLLNYMLTDAYCFTCHMDIPVDEVVIKIKDIDLSNYTSTGAFNFGNYIKTQKMNADSLLEIKKRDKIKQSQPWKRKGKNIK